MPISLDPQHPLFFVVLARSAALNAAALRSSINYSTRVSAAGENTSAP